MPISEFSVDSKVGAPLYSVNWSPPQAQAAICLIHGLGEHCRRYDHLAEYFNSHNIGLITYDQKGHGRTEGKRGHTPSMNAFLDDVSLMLQKTKELYPNLPLILYGHSMGGNIVLNYLVSRKPTLSGVITTGAFIQFVKEPPAIQLFVGRIMRMIYPKFTQPNALDVYGISTVRAEVAKYISDPLVHDDISSATAIDMIQTAKKLQRFNGAVNVPLLMMHGEKDRLTNPKGSREFSENIKGDVTYKEWKGLFHEIHNEHNQKEVLDDMMKWINNKIL